MAQTRTTPRQTPAQQRKVRKVMHEFKEGTLTSGAGNHPKVKNRKQAIAIALSEAGVPPKPGTTRAKQAAKKKTAATRAPAKRPAPARKTAPRKPSTRAKK